MKIRKILLFAGFFLAWSYCFAESPSDKQLLKLIMDHVKKNDELAEKYGYYYEARSRDLDGDGRVVLDEKRLYRIVWIEEKQYFELLKVNDRELNNAEKAEEAKRKEQFIKNLHEKKPSELKMEWDELFEKYNYSILPAEGDARYVVTFEPKPDGLKERTRMEKVFNHIAGKVWVDSEYNVLKAHLWLSDAVKFGFGILGSLNELQLQYSQQKFGNDVWLPSTLRLSYGVRVVLKGKHEDMDSRFFDFYPRPNPKTAPANN